MKKLYPRTAVALAALCIVPLFAIPVSAAPVDVVHCEWKGKVVLGTGLKLVVPGGQTGTTTFSGSVVCSGSLDGTSFSNAVGSSTGTGTFGDGPVSRAYGGATCSHNDGYIDLVIRLPFAGETITLAVEDGYWVRSAMAVITATANLGGAPGTAVGAITGRRGADGGQANCIQTAITEADMSLAIDAVGDIQYVIDHAPAVTLATSSKVDPGGTADLAANVSDGNGIGDLRDASLVVTDAHGRTVSSWSLGNFIAADENSVTLQVADHRLTGLAPWTATVKAADWAGNTSAESATIER